jgi:hypothetical protein
MGVRAAGARLVAVLMLTACGPVPFEVGRATAPPLELPTPTGPSVGPPTRDGACPAEFPGGQSPWVPEVPSTDTAGRLVPDADPVSAFVCRYGELGAPGQAVPLAGTADVTQGLDRVRSDLALPEALEGRGRACTQIGGPVVPHLVRLDYADGSLWLSAVTEANSCTDSGNGDFVTSAYLGDRLASAFDSGRWPAAPEVSGCFSGAGGRAGEEERLVPAGWTSALACTRAPDGSSPSSEPLTGDRARRVVELLADAELAPGSGGCSGGTDETYDVLFRYPEGNPVTVGLNVGCEPPLRNGSLDGRLDARRQTALADLLRSGG